MLNTIKSVAIQVKTSDSTNMYLRLTEQQEFMSKYEFIKYVSKFIKVWV